jgi:hypothetical protein
VSDKTSGVLSASVTAPTDGAVSVFDGSCPNSLDIGKYVLEVVCIDHRSEN